jgi:hypothetical protein
MKLTKEEEEIILAKRQEEEENDKPKKVGFLKHDLFFLNSRYPEVRFTIERFIEEAKGYWLEKRTIEDILKNIEKEIYELKAPAGTKFVCYIDDGEEVWFDDNNIGLEEMDADWAAQHLEKIEDISRKKSD